MSYNKLTAVNKNYFTKNVKWRLVHSLRTKSFIHKPIVTLLNLSIKDGVIIRWYVISWQSQLIITSWQPMWGRSMIDRNTTDWERFWRAVWSEGEKSCAKVLSGKSNQSKNRRYSYKFSSMLANLPHKEKLSQ